MKRKIRLTLLVLLSLLVLAGFGKKSVELLSDKKLIDLNAAIALCLPGADSLEPENNGKQEEVQNPEEPTATPKPTVAPTMIPESTGKARTIVISVRERVISFGLDKSITLVTLEERIRKNHKNGVDFQLVDDYAEAHVYREIIEMLEKLEAEIGVSYTRD